jgi:menaquinone-dependent protoporphyrinogen oxidase
MRVLVVYGSKMGGTAELAAWIVDELVEAGFEADLEDGADRPSPEGYDAVIVGGALYADRWQKGARRFAKRHADGLASLPTWAFSSGPLNDDAASADIPPTEPVQRILDRFGPRGHRTFGGRLSEDPGWVPASSMAQTELAGDWRDRTEVARWVAGIAAELRSRAEA